MEWTQEASAVSGEKVMGASGQSFQGKSFVAGSFVATLVRLKEWQQVTGSSVILGFLSYS